MFLSKREIKREGALLKFEKHKATPNVRIPPKIWGKSTYILRISFAQVPLLKGNSYEFLPFGFDPSSSLP
jgi:hypothetical protein